MARYGRVLLVTAIVTFKIVEWWNRVEAQVGTLVLCCTLSGIGVSPLLVLCSGTAKMGLLLRRWSPHALRPVLAFGTNGKV